MIRLTLGRTVLAAVILGIAGQHASAQTLTPQAEKINELIREGYKKADIKKPADKCSDTEFIRRAFIDIIGRIATVEEVIDFEKDAATNKRIKLVKRLLHEEKFTPKASGRSSVAFDYNSEYAEHWANLWGVWLMTRSTHPLYRDQMQMWLEIEFLKNTNHKELASKLLTATGRSNENAAVNFIIHHLGEPVPAEESAKLGKFDAVPITSRVTRLFLGLQTQCTQCHDHPFNKEWMQSDFWGVNAFFRQTLRDRTMTPAPGTGQRMVEPVQVELSDDKSQNPIGLVLYERRDGKRMASKPNFLKDLAQAEKGEVSGKTLSGSDTGGKSRREVMSEFVTKHDNIARAYVNRIWGHFFGRGLNKDATVDDFGSHNDVIHPDLQNYLAEEFIKYNYDQKALMEWITTSEAYSLSHVGNKEYTDPKYDAYFARMSLKAMSPEVLFEAITVAAKSDLRGTPEQRKQFRSDFTSKLVRNFGDDEGNELSFNGTVVQALLLMNGREINDQVSGGGKGIAPAKVKGAKGKGGATTLGGVSSIAGVVNAMGSPPKIYDELFLMALNRHPTPIEIGKLEQVRNGQAPVTLGSAAPPATTSKKGPTPKAGSNVKLAPGAGPTDVAFYQDVFWALLNTNEFILNH